MLSRKLKHLLLASALAASGAWAANDMAPDELVAKMTADVLDAVHNDKQLQAGDKQKALQLAESKILPLVDFRRMTMLAAGKSWRQASEEQQGALVREFRTLLVRTYSNALGTYQGQRLEVDPLTMDPGATEVTVKNRYITPGQPPIPVDYRMRKSADGWKAYDIVVDGVSLVTTYRPTFDEEIRRSGVDGLIHKLAQKNQGL
jgi:phospholipid transport system substrate-binding protein